MVGRNVQMDEEMVLTKDGYFLTLHHLLPSPPLTVGTAANHVTTAETKTVVLWHGFMMNSEVWMCHPDRGNNLALLLHEKGFEVQFCLI